MGMNIINRLLPAFLVLTLFTSGLSGPTVGADPPPTRQNHLIIGVGRDFFDGPDSRTYMHGSTNTWEALTYLDESLRASPWLAESWKSDHDDRVWTFRLRQGVRFHDGSLMTASDVVTSLERMKHHPRCDPTGIFRNVVSIGVSGPKEVVIRLTESSPAFPNHLAYYSSPVLKPSTFGKDGRIRELIGTGPYRVERVQKGQSVFLTRFDGYWGTQPAFPYVTFKTVVDAQARVMALAAGEIDAIADVGGIIPEQAQTVGRLKQVVLKLQEVATTHYLLFNTGRPVFSKPETRRWLADRIDRLGLVETFAGKAGRPATDFYSPLAADWRYGGLIPASGTRPNHSDQTVIILVHSGTIHRWPYLEMAQVIQGQIQADGFQAKIEVQETGAWQNTFRSGKWDLALQPNTLMTGDPDFFFSYYIASGAPYHLGYQNPEVDKWIQNARIACEIKTRQDLYRRICDQLNLDLPILPLYHDICLYAHGAKIDHFMMDHTFRVRLDLITPKESLHGP